MSYVRLQAKYDSGVTGKPCGVFGAAYHLIQRGKLSADEIAVVEDVKAWFEANLPIPPFYEDGNTIRAITWFKRTSEDMVARLQPVKQIVESHGVEIEIAETDDPGEIVYEDEYQIGTV